MARPLGSRDADYEEKRDALLQRMTERMMRREIARPSLRQLADAAGVTVPTLRHYFGGRSDVVTAILKAYRRAGEDRLKMLAKPQGALDASIRSFATSFLMGMRAPRAVRLGDVFAVSIAEGLLDRDIGPKALEHIVDPAVDVLRARLDAHVAAGEMRSCDTRAAALLLLSPLLVAVLHQDQMGGSVSSPTDLPGAFQEICRAFVRAYQATP